LLRRWTNHAPRTRTTHTHTHTHTHKQAHYHSRAVRREPNQLALEIVAKCWDLTNGTALRDEIYIQLCKQTYMNRNL
jgi:hypothetical protein